MYNRIYRQRLHKLTALLCTASVLVSGSTVYASSSQQLEQEKNNLQGQINNMSEKLSDLSRQLEDITQEVETKAQEVDQANEDLALAIQNEAAQYESMKERIKFMYEGGSISLLQILLSSENMGDFLNKAEYVSNISDYDRDMLANFKAARDEVEARQASLEQQQVELGGLQEDLSSQVSNLENHVSSSSADLDKYSAQIQKARAAEALAAQQALADQQAAQSQKAETAKETQDAVSQKTPETVEKPKETQKTQETPDASKTDSQNPESSSPADTDSPSESADSDGLKNLGSFRITHYCNCKTCCGKWSGGNTASGTTPTAGRTIAVDTSVIPMGSRVVINGHTYIAEDTGRAIKGNRIDIYVNTHETALSNGTYYADVYMK